MNEGLWYLDNGARNHMTSDRHLFQESNRLLHGIIRFGIIRGLGWVMLQCQDKGQMRLDNAYLLKLKFNILSLEQFNEQGWLTNRDRELVENTRLRVKIISKFTSFKIKSRIEGYIGK